MAAEKLTLRQQILLCQQIARLARAKLPLQDRLSESVGVQGLPSEISQASQHVCDRLMQGKSLKDALVSDDSADSRILSACLEVGQSSNCLDQALENWTSIHLANDRAKKSLQTAMVYPVALIVIAWIAVGWTAWQLIPEIRSAYLQYEAMPPTWLKWIFVARDHFAWTVMSLVLMVTIPLFYWHWNRGRVDLFGVPRTAAKRLRLQALATRLAGLQLLAERPLSESLPLCLAAMGTAEPECQKSFQNLRLHRTLASMPLETTMVLASLHSGIVSRDQAAEHCNQISHRLTEQADQHDQRDTRWLPVLIALLVGGLTLATYGLLVYVPWIGLMLRIGSSPT